MVHKFAFESSYIIGEAISAVVMAELARHYGVMGTPYIVLNRVHHLPGRASEETLLSAIQSLDTL